LVEIVVTVLAGVVARVFGTSVRGPRACRGLHLADLTGVPRVIAVRDIAVGMVDGALSALAVRVEFLVDLIVAYDGDAALRGEGSFGQRRRCLQWPNHVKYAIIPASCGEPRLSVPGPRSNVGSIDAHSAAAIALAFGLYALTSGTPGSPFPDASPSLIMGVAFGIALVIGVPIGFAMLFGVFLSTWGANLLPVAGVVHNMVGGASSFVLLAIPFFLSAGYLMNLGGLSTRIIYFASALVGIGVAVSRRQTFCTV
jgi:hypothetical protein